MSKKIGFALLISLLAAACPEAYAQEKKEIHQEYGHKKISLTLHMTGDATRVLGLTYKDENNIRYFLEGSRVALASPNSDVDYRLEDVYIFTPEKLSYWQHDLQTNKKLDADSVPWTNPESAANLSRLILRMTTTEGLAPAKDTMRKRLSVIQAAQKKMGETYARLAEAVKQNPDSVVAPETLKRLEIKIFTSAERMKQTKELVEAADSVEKLPENLKDPYGNPVNKSVYYWVCHRTLSETSDLTQNLLRQTELLLKLVQ